MKYLKILSISLITIIMVQPIYALTIKIGSIAPTRTPWDKALRKLGREWKEITQGAVKLKIYPGGITGNEIDMIRKIRLGTLGGATLSLRGLKKICSDIYVLNIPFLFNSDEEFLFVLENMKPYFEKKIEKKGFKTLIWSMTGWVHFFSKNPVVYPEDMKKHKLSYTVGEPKMEQAWKISGYHVIPNTMEDLMMALQSGMVSAFYLPPLWAGSGQYFALAPNMCSLKVAPLAGAVVLSNRIWKKIPEQHKEEMMKAGENIAADLYKTVIELEKDTIKTMCEHGLIINTVPDNAKKKWKKVSDKGMEVLIGEVFSEEIYTQMLRYLEEYHQLDDN